MHARQQYYLGVGILVWQGEKVLVGKRKGSHGAGYWALPGGHLEDDESFEACAAREVLEETGLAVHETAILTVTRDLLDHGQKPYVTVFVQATLAPDSNVTPTTCEPDKCEGWCWVMPSDLGSGEYRPLFEPLDTIVRCGALHRR